MIYIPKRAVFVHIPRAAGNSITQAVSTVCVGKNIDVFIGTGSHRYENFERFSRHSTARTLKDTILEWDEIYKFAVIRKDEDRLESAKRLVQRDIERKVYLDPTCTLGWREVLISKERQKLFWESFHSNDFFIYGPDGEDLGVEIYNFEDLPDRWHEICDKCQIPRCDLPKLNSS